MEYRPGRSHTYRFTVNMNDESDLASVQALRATVKRSNSGKRIKKRVKLQYRRPELNATNRLGLDSGCKYGWGGSVTKAQKPSEADVYVYPQ